MEKREEHKHHKGMLKFLSKNYWAIIAIVLAIVLVSLFALGRINFSSIGADAVGEKVLAFANAQGADATLIEVTDQGQVYEVVLEIQGQQIPVYATKDGENLISNLIPLTTEAVAETETASSTTEIPTTETPEVGLYIWSYCPYGVTALAPFAEVAKLLRDSTANFKIYLYYSGHGDFEVQQNKIQACIQELSYTDAYWNYAIAFANDIYTTCSGNITCDLEKSTALMNSLGIDSKKVLTCVESDGESLLEEHYNAAKEVSVTGSPSLVINGVKANVARTAEAYKTAICSAFNSAPEKCSAELDSTAGTSTGNC
jgi:hypothetical protein